jgi:hypothetical protein
MFWFAIAANIGPVDGKSNTVSNFFSSIRPIR